MIRDLRFAIRNLAAMRCIAGGSGDLSDRGYSRVLRLAPRALTLIELLVVIVILTTLVAGVIPILSPNNDSRKIREAARGLQTYIMMAQAEAARTGRPHGIAFRESSPGSGVALEVFRLEVPPPFAGFSNASTARIIREHATGQLYVQFVWADSFTGTPPNTFPPTQDYTRDPIPPKLIRYHDEINIAGKIYRLIDTDFDGDGTPTPLPIPNDDYYSVYGANNHTEWTFLCEEISAAGQTLSFVTGFPGPDPQFWTYSLTAPKSYKIIRQPISSVEAPYQLPAGVAIDLQGSKIENGVVPNTLPVNSLNRDPSFGPYSNPAVVGVMFSPTGAVDSFYFNGNTINSLSKVYLLLGRVENGGRTATDLVFDFSTLTSSDQLKSKRKEINWLDLDSRWLSIAASSGRVVVNENAFVDPRNLADFDNDNAGNPQSDDPEDQIEAAHQFAHEMRRGGGR